ncbi:MAG: DNA translocase FtsK 4TM domain-containing protein [Dysgonamonadaceae bacterium]|jgi:S-DNA-T family DNA segregation ATPase FtsK/SpoIIIE|nr:DNA translocase FtsK 4TM domain-containing protein [Dysgonamonadaceae bacterium]
MAKSKATKKEAQPSRLKVFLTSNTTHYITGLVLLFVTAYAVLAMVSFFFTGGADQSKIEGVSFFDAGRISGIENWTGKRGAVLSNLLLNEGFGISTFFLLVLVFILSLRLMKAHYFNLFRNFVIYTILAIWSSVTLAFAFGSFTDSFYIGGKHGRILADWLSGNFGVPGAALILLFVFIVWMVICTAKTIPFLQRFFKSNPKKKIVKEEPVTDDDDETEDDEPEIIIPPIKTNNQAQSSIVVQPGNTDDDFVIEVAKEDDSYIPEPTLPEPEIASPYQPFTPPGLSDAEEDASQRLLQELGKYDPTADLSHYELPPLDLLKQYDSSETKIDYAEQNENKNRIIHTLKNYGINIKSIKATVGPTITLYEIVPEDGVRISKIRNLEDDIALSLAAIGIRIIAPMPGKGTIGIEVPNKEAKIVSMYSIIGSKKYQESHFDLPIALGKTITNEVFMVDLCKMPHLLVAGATGQGKSVGLNAAITSLLYKKHPAELKFVLVDPKMVEFSIYSVIEKHFLAKLPDSQNPIITDFTKVIYTLNSLTKEMDDRYALLQKAGSRNVKEYNEKFINRRLNPMKGHKYMPYIVVIIDEFGDLIMTAGKEIELPIARIAQKARAVGIHMIIATQRPTTNIITGTIKANFPARVAFRVTSMIDSRTILDGPGANQLIGRGDLLFFQGSDMTRVQCAFVDTPEVDKISKFIGNQTGYPTAFALPEYTGDESEDKAGSIDMSNLDPLFDEAARLIVVQQQGSTSLLQRKFEIGFNRAGRLMDQLEAANIVGQARGSKPREVLIVDEYHLEQILNSLKS